MEMQKEYEISIDPRILELLGPNLYTNIYYILAELIANAYDADAHNVYIITKSDRIIVEDDGNGMSYEEGVKKYLCVAEESRKTPAEAFTQEGRRKMGRKGVGKLAALSVSERVEVKTVHNDDKSGFVLARYIDKDNKLEAIPEDRIIFERISHNGTSIEMLNPQYTLNKTPEVVKKNILKIFPHVNKDFRIHIKLTGKKELTIEDADKEIIGQLGGLYILDDEFAPLASFFNNEYASKEKPLLKIKKSFKKLLKLRNKNQEEKDYQLEIKGWCGVYRSTSGRKKDADDFPDNFISLYSNKKMGEYNILPSIGKNRLDEVYVVGQLHIDLFEETELPDMALSNRQGYKTDDERYKQAIAYIREDLLPKVLELRTLYSSYKKESDKLKKLDRQKREEEELRKKVDAYKESASKNATEKITNLLGARGNANSSGIQNIIGNEINELLPIAGFKRKVDAKKKKILLSQTRADKPLSDIIYKMLLFNGIPAEDIIYSNCDDQVCRIPEGSSIYDYLREFFVESYSTEKIYVLYVTSKTMSTAWGALAEVGAGWITKVGHKVFNLKVLSADGVEETFTPQAPLNIQAEWHNSQKNSDSTISMEELDRDRFAAKIEAVCQTLGYSPKSREENLAELCSYLKE